MSHTKEEWEYFASDDGIFITTAYDVTTQQKNLIHGGYYDSTNKLIISSCESATTRRYYPTRAEAEANARRIVACVNACAGMSTEDLEETIKYHGDLQTLFAKWKEQRDELHTALKWAQDELRM